MQTFFATLAFLMSLNTSAFAAAPSCLKTVSDDDLLNEVSLRMGRSTPNPIDYAIPSFSCRFQTLIITLVDTSTGTEGREELNLTDVAACSTLETFLSNRAGNKSLPKPSIVAACRFQTLLRVSLNPNGQLKRLQDQNSTDVAACMTARDRINDAL
ncbi:MAG: hypothetical protein V4760_00630 [Bdellovibrionota bacterium]